MNYRKGIVCTIAACGLFACGWVAAQQRYENTPEAAAYAWRRLPIEQAETYNKINARGKETGKYVEALNELRAAMKPMREASVGIYPKIMANPNIAYEIANLEVNDYWHRVVSVEGAPQATEISGEIGVHLQALQVAQNARIIQLLQKIADKQK